jgi:hypothetical protein
VRSRKVFARLNADVLIEMPSASVRMATTANPGVPDKERKARRRWFMAERLSCKLRR